MAEKVCVDIVEQHAIFDGKPEFSVPLAAVVNLLNWHAFGGTPNDMVDAQEELENAKRYKITLHLYYEEVK